MRAHKSASHGQVQQNEKSPSNLLSHFLSKKFRDGKQHFRANFKKTTEEKSFSVFRAQM